MHGNVGIAVESKMAINLINLSDKEKEDIMDIPLVPKGILGSSIASMQKRCKAKKNKDEALQLCLPQKAQPWRSHPPGRLQRCPFHFPHY